MIKFHRDYENLIENFANPLPGKPDTCEYVIEECSELIQAIQHAKRGRVNVNVPMEIAHVLTLIDALMIRWNIPPALITEYKQDLINRYGNAPSDGRHVEGNHEK